MSLLRIRGSLSDPSQGCQWALIGADQQVSFGECPLAQLTVRAERVQLLVPAAQVLMLGARLPPGARRQAGSLLAFAVEERSAAEPEANQVSWLGTEGTDDMLAVIDKAGLLRWRAELEAIGMHTLEVQPETLLLPLVPGEWSLAWDGHEGFARTGELDGAATDRGDRDLPPTWLRLRLRQAESAGARPLAIAIYTIAAEAAPDVGAWSRELATPVRLAGAWDWRDAPAGAGVSLARERRRWRLWPGLAARLRPAAAILGIALFIHLAALLAQVWSLRSEQRMLRQEMDSRFRAAFPDAVAVADPELQMRRKLAEARHLAGLGDEGDFLPMIGDVASATRHLPAASLRTISYESGRITIELSAVDPAGVRQAVDHLLQSGRAVDPLPSSSAPGTPVVLTVRVR